MLLRKVGKKCTVFNRLRKELVFLAAIIVLGLYYLLRSLQNNSVAIGHTKGPLQIKTFTPVLIGCEIPILFPFGDEVVQDNRLQVKLVCEGSDWVRCYQSKCRLSEADEIKKTLTNITCGFQDIRYHSDKNDSMLGPISYVRNDETYKLIASDHVRVSCTGNSLTNGKLSEWSGNAVGLRSIPKPTEPRPVQDSFNVLVLAFDSASRTELWTLMPKTWRVLTYELRATVMQGYSVLSQGIASGLLPTLTGMTDSELTNYKKNNLNISNSPFIFHKLNEYGYRTAFLENIPFSHNLFEKHLKDLENQPLDFYLRPLFLAEATNSKRKDYCVGDTPVIKLMLNMAEQFMNLAGNRFAFTFIADVTNSDSNIAHSVDDDMAALLRDFHRQHREDTLLVVTSDHGPRNKRLRNSLRHRLEARLPLMALLLPYKLLRTRPHAASALQENARVLTTPYDFHATLLDVLGMREDAIVHKEQGSLLNRGLTMLEPIPSNRSCSDAGVEPHWCVTLCWKFVTPLDPYFHRTGDALVQFINTMLIEAGPECVPRSITLIEWVLREVPSRGLLASNSSQEDLTSHTPVNDLNYQIKATILHLAEEDRFMIKSEHISRTNPYDYESSCIAATYPHLVPFCYCRELSLENRKSLFASKK